MKKAIILFVLPLFAACNTDDTVAEKESPSSAEEQLDHDLASLCTSACRTVVRCDIGGSSSCDCSSDGPCECDPPEAMTPSDCKASCMKAMTEDFAGRGEHCAALAIEMLECFTNLDACSAAKSCEADEGEVKACRYSEDRPPSAGVLCQAGFGNASASGSETPSVCDEGMEDCSDGHVYRHQCAPMTGGGLSCVCMVDGVRGNEFQVEGEFCPTVGQLNSSCGWNIATGGEIDETGGGSAGTARGGVVDYDAGTAEAPPSE